MAASSVTGAGEGSSRKITTTELATLVNAPSIIFTGIIDAGDVVASPPSSPPATNDTVTFPYILTGGADSYVIMLTSINAGYVYVSDRDEDEEGNFSGFSFVAETEGLIQYLVAKVGSRPNI